MTHAVHMHGLFYWNSSRFNIKDYMCSLIMKYFDNCLTMQLLLYIWILHTYIYIHHIHIHSVRLGSARWNVLNVSCVFYYGEATHHHSNVIDFKYCSGTYQNHWYIWCRLFKLIGSRRVVIFYFLYKMLKLGFIWIIKPFDFNTFLSCSSLLLVFC